jgi:hypothetical protein
MLIALRHDEGCYAECHCTDSIYARRHYAESRHADSLSTVQISFKHFKSFLRFCASIQASLLLVSFQLASPAEAAQW